MICYIAYGEKTLLKLLKRGLDKGDLLIIYNHLTHLGVSPKMSLVFGLFTACAVPIQHFQNRESHIVVLADPLFYSKGASFL